MASKDIFLWPSQRASEVRLRVSLFGGQGTFEVDADKIGANFENARLKEDIATIRECLNLGLEGIAEALPDDRIADHTIRAMMFAKLLDPPADGRAFLTSLTLPQHGGIQAKAPKGSVFAPTFKFELDNPEEMWHYTFELSRAYRDQAEVFMSMTVNFLSGNSCVNMDERYAFAEQLLSMTWEQIGFQTGEKN